LIAVERGSRMLVGLAERGRATGGRVVVPAPALAQVWRGSPRQVLLSRFLNLSMVEVDVLTEPAWRAAGELFGITGTSDVVDAAVIVCARTCGARVVVTSDPDDLRQLDPSLAYVTP
jgi:hypothetical protein